MLLYEKTRISQTLAQFILYYMLISNSTAKSAFENAANKSRAGWDLQLVNIPFVFRFITIYGVS
jgi:hypothetical protein